LDYLTLATDLARAQAYSLGVPDQALSPPELRTPAPITYAELTPDYQLRACGEAVSQPWYEEAAFEAFACSGERSTQLLAKAFSPETSEAELGRYVRTLLRDYLGACAEARGDNLAEFLP
jgi:hypothetical protein